MTDDANRTFLRDARMRLGKAWGLGRPLSYSELGRALGLAGDPGNGARDLERRGIVSGPVRRLIDLYLDPRLRITSDLARYIITTSMGPHY